MLKKILAFADKHDMLPEEGLVLTCVSGGADSMCLLNALLEISTERGFTVGALHFNHMLRGDESDRDEAFVRGFCEARKILFYSGSSDVAAYARNCKLGIEEAARKTRYAFFNDTAARLGAVRIATAHTSDDNAETFIMNVTRGAAGAGLAGIPPARGKIIRPMLRVTRDDVLKYAEEYGIKYVVDSTNSLDIYTRNRIRHSVIPILKDINPRFPDTIASLTEVLRASEDYLSVIADSFITERCENGKTEVAELLRLPEAVSGRVIRKLSGVSLTFAHVDSVLRLCKSDRSTARVSLPGVTVWKEYGSLAFVGEPAPDESPLCGFLSGGFPSLFPEDGEVVIIPVSELKMSCKLTVIDDRINKSLTSFLFKCADLCGRITVRPRHEGDKIKLYGHTGTKTLKKLFNEHRIPPRKRPLVPVIADEAGVLAVYGLGYGDRAVASPGDLVYEIKFEGDLGL